MKQAKNTKTMMPPMVTIIVLLMIISTVGITRLQLSEQAKELRVSSNNSYSNIIGLNRAETYIMNSLVYDTERFTNQNATNNTYKIFLNNLQTYLTSPRIELKYDQADLVSTDVKQLINIINLEDEVDFARMNVDARGMAVQLAERIYQGCGLELKTNFDGTIKKITTSTGKVMYQQENQLLHSHFRIDVLIVTVVTLLLLLGLIILIVRKNNILDEKMGYNGTDEEIYA